ncbi:MAG: phosphoribosylformylglycinamidine synthase subunit PurS [Chthoniobacterales bacterium]
MKIRVTVLPKPSVLDPQGVATAGAMKHLGWPGNPRVRVGKMIEIEAPGATPDEEQLHAICRDLLSNPVIEDYTIEFEDR